MPINTEHTAFAQWIVWWMVGVIVCRLMQFWLIGSVCFDFGDLLSFQGGGRIRKQATASVKCCDHPYRGGEVTMVTIRIVIRPNYYQIDG